MMMRKTAFLVTLLAASLVACGGGDDAAFQGSGATGGTGGTGGTAGTGGTSAVQFGSGSGGSFQSGTVAVASPSLSAGGSTGLSVSFVQSDGTLFTQRSNVTFNSPCIAAGTAAITPSATAETSTGIASVTYVAKGCAGTDTVTASSTINGANRSATGVVTVAAAAVGSIEFVSATPANIALKGTGEAGRPESSTVIFRVRDASGGPRAGAQVSFALNTALGGIALQPSSGTATSDAQGNVQVVVAAGTVATSVKVTATVVSSTPTISTQSGQLTVTTGVPTAGSFSLAVGCFNVEGLDHDGVTTPVTARLADRFQNPAPDGTAVTFTAEGGAITAQCTTATNDTEGGLCSVNWRSSNPRPANGRVSLLAKAIGEESFTDANGNGAFDVGETFADRPEPFRDDNEDGIYTAGTDADFFDFNNNGVRDAADGRFNGVLCNDPARCGGANTRSTGIGQQNLIIMSGSTATITLPDGSVPSPITLTRATTQAVQFWIRDRNGNPMPGNTEVSATFSGTGVTVAAPSTFKIPCSTAAVNAQVGGTTLFSFALTAANAAGSGQLTISVKTPRGLETLGSVTVNVP